MRHGDRAGDDEMLAVVQQQQRTSSVQRARQRLERGLARDLDDARSRCDSSRDKCRVDDGGQLDEPDRGAVEAPGCLQRESRLAGATSSGKRQEPYARQPARKFGDLVLTADEARQLNGESVRKYAGASLRP